MNGRALTRLGTAALLAVLWVATPEVTQAQMGPAKVAVAPVVQGEVAAGQSYVGSVMPVRTSLVGAPIGGRVDHFYVNEGDRVLKGQPLAKLRTKTIDLEIAAAQAELDVRRQELKELENGSRPEEIDQAKARQAGAEALWQFRRQRRDRIQTLIPTRGATQDELQEAVSLADQAEQAYREAKAALKMFEEGPRKEKIAQARAKVLAQEETVNLLKDQQEKHTIVAPFDGYVVAEHTEVGQWVVLGGPVAEVIELDQVDIEVQVLEDHIAALRPGMPARIEVTALPQEKVVGRVAAIVARANLKSRTFPVKVRVDNSTGWFGSEPLLKAGMFTRVTLQVGRREPAILVPKDALVLGGPTPVVYAVQSDPADANKGKVQRIPVELGVADDQGRIQVKGDLKPGQQVVVQGNERLRPGQEVQIAQVVTAQK